MTFIQSWLHVFLGQHVLSPLLRPGVWGNSHPSLVWQPLCPFIGFCSCKSPTHYLEFQVGLFLDLYAIKFLVCQLASNSRKVLYDKMFILEPDHWAVTRSLETASFSSIGLIYWPLALVVYSQTRIVSRVEKDPALTVSVWVIVPPPSTTIVLLVVEFSESKLRSGRPSEANLGSDLKYYLL